MHTPWDVLQLAYFIGYAMWNYLTTPFLFTYPGVEAREIEPWHEAGADVATPAGHIPGLDRDPKPSRFNRVTRNPANVMSLRFRRKGPFRRRRQRLQSAGLLPRVPTVA